MNFRKNGFTIVELLIVIVVIGILAVISIVAYSGIQDRANDTIRRDAGKKLEKAYRLYIAESGKHPYELNCGHNDGGAGFIQYTEGASGAYAGDTCIDLLAQSGYLSKDFTESIPVGTSFLSNRKDRTYMIESCSVTPKTAALLWYLKKPTAEESANFAKVSQTCNGSSGSSYTTYGMNSGVILDW